MVTIHENDPLQVWVYLNELVQVLGGPSSVSCTKTLFISLSHKFYFYMFKLRTSLTVRSSAKYGLLADTGTGQPLIITKISLLNLTNT